MSKSKTPGPKRPGRGETKSSVAARPVEDLIKCMEDCPTAESLNSDVITPFIQALVAVCDARGYVVNVYGEHCNLTITPEDHAEHLYELIGAYLDQNGLG